MDSIFKSGKMYFLTGTNTTPEDKRFSERVGVVAVGIMVLYNVNPCRERKRPGYTSDSLKSIDYLSIMRPFLVLGVENETNEAGYNECYVHLMQENSFGPAPSIGYCAMINVSLKNEKAIDSRRYYTRYAAFTIPETNE